MAAAATSLPARPALQVGGHSGYSARNFVAAAGLSIQPTVYTVDISPVPTVAPNHIFLLKNASLLTPSDVHNKTLASPRAGARPRPAQKK